MGTSIYLSNSNVQIAIGDGNRSKVQVQKLYSVAIQEGSLLNGVITSEGELASELTSLWQRLELPTKDVSLVIEGTQFVTKAVTLPKLNEKKTRALIKNEFTDLENQEAYYFDYRVDGEQKAAGLVNLICVAAPKEYIEGYIRLFESIGVTLSGIDASFNCRLKAFERLFDIENKTFISLMLDGSNLTSTLFVDGKYKYYSKTRIFSEHGTADFGLEVARTVSSIMQFHSTQKTESAIEFVYLGNFGRADFEVSDQSIANLGLDAFIPNELPQLQLPAKEQMHLEMDLASGGAAIDFMNPIGNLIEESRDINFIKRKGRMAKEKASDFQWKALLPIAVVLGILLIASIVLIGMNIGKNTALTKAEAYISDSHNQEQYNKSMELEAQIMQQQESIRMGELAWNVIGSYPIANTSIKNAVNESAGTKVTTTIDSYDAVTGVYNFTAMAANVTDIYDFINELKMKNLFASLEYSGYNYTESNKQYDIHVTGYLSESAGK